MTAGLRHAGESAATFDLVAAAFDSNWRERGRYHQTVELPGATGISPAVYDLHARLPLRPGPYEIRLAVESDGRAGSVLANIDVPDLSSRPLALSDLVLGRVSGKQAEGGPLADLLAVLPTTLREFRVDDTVTAFMHIYQRNKQTPVPVALTTRIRNGRDETVLDHAATLAPAHFSPHGMAGHRIDLPLSRLGGGDYLLTIEAAAGDRRDLRSVRFSIR